MNLQVVNGVAAGAERSDRLLQATPASPLGLSGMTALVFAIACGLSVANVYFAHPLLDAIAHDFAIAPASVGIVVTVTQIGYALGLFFIVPLGDLFDRRKLIAVQAVLSAVALSAVGIAPSAAMLLTGLAVVGLLAVVVQVLVAYAADLAVPSERGRAVGTVTSGVILGILLARFVAGVVADFAGWRWVYLVSAALTLIMALVLYLILPRHEAERPRTPYPRLLGSVVLLFVQEPLLRVRAVLAMLIFASFNVLWAPLVLPLSAAPFSLSHTEIGLFGLAGVAGALGARWTGGLVDRGRGQLVTGLSLLLMMGAWLPIAFMGVSLWLLVAGIVMLDLAIQAVHVTNQSLIFSRRPHARSRLVGGYMIFYSLGSALGSIASTMTYGAMGWSGVCVLGASIGLLALLVWALTLRVGQ
ncbi:MFS transporter [Mesorhizobium loti]|uniref:MFS transporter n=1 Tax=Mesorhizobium jarvisii TaxID=1777867 RepID=A0A6M7TQP7_9HYPH|nr:MULTISPECIES: MFS transporter [Mesorhizobium]QKC67110.1 MFS transporter [Mesorhizobium jarvisii]QKD13021.1 MFS transporter [Mesorhizobium loti]RJT37167.1 MFS transporter [Mesorhizobium jarvisii]BCH01780.1 MFS transporter [Mesorhizobium sp. 131-2-5]